ncbi:MAG: HopJ type III effector protein [Gammaproteobacteria bacterium]
MTVSELINKLNCQPDKIEFAEVMATIEAHYTYTPTRFSNGKNGNIVVNEAGSNEGSCKIFAFARRHALDQRQTLACFGTYYRDDVLGNPAGDDHANIRRFMHYGWDGIRFDGEALQAK